MIQDTLFYDGRCPLCVKEMDKLRRIAGDNLLLVDIHALPSDANERDDLPDNDTLLRVLHLRRGEQFLTGIDANVAAWQHTRWGAIWRCLTLPGIRIVVDWCYRRWAKWRYDRLYCDTSCRTN